MVEAIGVERPALDRVLSPLGVMFLTFSALSPVMSVYIAGDTLLHIAGTGAAIALLVGGLISASLSLLFAELGAAFPGAGGIYPSLSAIVGPYITFPMVVLGVPVVIASTAFSALGLSDYLRVLIPGLPALPVVFGGIFLTSLIAILNVRMGALVTGIFLAVEATALLLLSIVAGSHVSRSLGAVIAHPVMVSHGVLVATPLATICLGLATGVWITAGSNYALYFAEEMRSPRKIGRVVAWIGFIAAFISATPIILMLMSAPNVETMLQAEAPIAAYLAVVGGPTITALISLGVVAALFNCMIATVMIFSRYLYATARDGLWPAPVNKFLSQISARTFAPWAATLVLAALSLATSLCGERAILILISGDVSAPILMALGIWISRPRGQTGRWFRAPLHPLIPAISLTFGLFSVVVDWLDPNAGRPSVIILGGLFIFGLIYYRLRLRKTAQTWRIGGKDFEPASTEVLSPAGPDPKELFQPLSA